MCKKNIKKEIILSWNNIILKDIDVGWWWDPSISGDHKWGKRQISNTIFKIDDYFDIIYDFEGSLSITNPYSSDAFVVCRMCNADGLDNNIWFEEKVEPIIPTGETKDIVFNFKGKKENCLINTVPLTFYLQWEIEGSYIEHNILHANGEFVIKKLEIWRYIET